MDYAAILSSGDTFVVSTLRNWVKQKAETDLAEIAYLQIKWSNAYIAKTTKLSDANMKFAEYNLKMHEARLNLERANLEMLEEQIKGRMKTLPQS